jgi:hypothetical protein
VSCTAPLSIVCRYDLTVTTQEWRVTCESDKKAMSQSSHSAHHGDVAQSTASKSRKDSKP